MYRIFTLLLLLAVISASAQDKDKLFGSGEAPKPKAGFILAANGDFDIPAGDIAKEFGLSYRVGPGILYKTSSNWLFGAKCDFILGDVVKQDSLMINIRDKYSTDNTHVYEFINNNGEREGVPVYERGYMIALQAGKIIPLGKKHPDNGLELLTSAGFIQYKIDIYNDNKDIPELQGNYLKGYDRLTNGAFVEEYAGYIYFAKNRLLNFTIGVDLMVGFTQDRRSFLYDVMRTDNAQRTDFLFGIRGGWFIPIFKRKSEDLLFE